jgi:hypothetical protein
MVGGRGPMMMNRPVFAGVQRGAVHFGTSFNRPFSPFFFHHHRHFFPWWWYRYGGLYAYPYYSYPSNYGDYRSQDSYDYANAYAQTSEMQQAEIDRLNDELERLRQEREMRAAPPPPPSQAPGAKAESQPTQLVFRDKRIEEVRNYAIVGQTFWVFGEQRARKIPLAEVDIPATKKANDDRGVEFQLPD